MSDILPFECDHERDCATNGRDPQCANSDVCFMPTCPECGAAMVVKVMEMDSAWLPDGLSWARYVCPECEGKR